MPRSELRLVRLAVDLVAVVTFALIVVRALGTVDPYWDTLQYHWPYAARAAGMCDADCFAMFGELEERYRGFPMLYHWAFGWLWRLSGTPAAGHALTIAAVLALCGYLRRRFAVPLAWSWLAFLAVPLVQIHLSASYADLFANALLTVGILVLVGILHARQPPTTGELVIALIALGLAAGTKLQLIAVAALVWLAIVVATTRLRPRLDGRTPWIYALVLALLGSIAILPQAAVNLWHFHNPFYPIAFKLAGFVVPGPETVSHIQQATSVGTSWKASPGWLRWLASVLEFDAFRARPVPWAVDQGWVTQDNPSFRMGGYFVAYVLGLAIVFVSRIRERPLRPLFAVMATVTVICALLPNSHELRYYQFWMLTLVSLVLILAFSPSAAAPAQPRSLREARVLIPVALASVVSMTGAIYLTTYGLKIGTLIAPTNAVVDALPAGTTLCIGHLSRDAILYTWPFHRASSIHVRSIVGENAIGCDSVIVPP
jgi:hypothetical protein